MPGFSCFRCSAFVRVRKLVAPTFGGYAGEPNENSIKIKQFFELRRQDNFRIASLSAYTLAFPTVYVSLLILASILTIDKRGIIYFRAFIFLILRQAEVPSVERRLSTGAQKGRSVLPERALPR